MILKNDYFLRSLLRKSVPYTPVWFMRQAGRYLPEYRKVRKQVGSFMNLVTNPEYACKVTLQPLERYPLDAAILFSDILTIPHAMGLGLNFLENHGPIFSHPTNNEESIIKLTVPDLNDLNYVFDTIRLVNKELDGKVPLIGFSGSPWTLACYMVEGQSSKEYKTIKTMLYSRPDLLHKILEVNTESIIQYLNSQIEAGVQAIMLFDSWGGILSDEAFKVFSLDYNKKIFSKINRQRNGNIIPIIHFTKGGAVWIKDISSSGCDAIGVDWTINLREARDKSLDSVAIQGNMDPMVLLGSHKSVISEARRIIDSFGMVGESAGHIFNLGHGMNKDTPHELVLDLVNEIHSYSRQYHV
ncbi:uroporphyrinogen decarboxylase [Candidatus Kinetoplastidibacterium crithidiae]|uniref:Uroporphyrinogen decarboxylase n=2 Tax=Candidatus Kinetoplastidibacterium crithidiae TaxID=33056 RepID=M1M5B9_9PROT|nr:uroporphyrinogen decarboxylase [Candidatus Kinetoplastibacterium crithidii]AEM25264.1 uroporphyrinogen III decarboxilase [Candidatus Kinetoplastibacterium crithidii]AGF47360.1 uroporphyrinogen decarboxylase uroD [Candidatus Kinetoplastibacterium crithidii TCC036E]